MKVLECRRVFLTVSHVESAVPWQGGRGIQKAAMEFRSDQNLGDRLLSRGRECVFYMNESEHLLRSEFRDLPIAQGKSGKEDY